MLIFINVIIVPLILTVKLIRQRDEDNMWQRQWYEDNATKTNVTKTNEWRQRDKDSEHKTMGRRQRHEDRHNETKTITWRQQDEEQKKTMRIRPWTTHSSSGSLALPCGWKSSSTRTDERKWQVSQNSLFLPGILNIHLTWLIHQRTTNIICNLKNNQNRLGQSPQPKYCFWHYSPWEKQHADRVTNKFTHIQHTSDSVPMHSYSVHMYMYWDQLHMHTHSKHMY